MTYTYIGIGAARIQTWLIRTPELALMRGASKALSKETGRAAIERFVSSRTELGGIEVPVEAGDIDGVVVLRTAQTGPEHAGKLAMTVVAHLEQRLPGVEWEVWSCDADDYIAAFHAQGQDSGGRHQLTWLPALQDLPVGRPCGCRRELSGPGDRETNAEYGRDCDRRSSAQAEVRNDERSDSQQSDWAEIPGTMAQDFAELAKWGGVDRDTAPARAHGRDDSRNHLATIVADGNAMGQFFDLVAEAPGGIDVKPLRDSAVAGLGEASREAVRAAGKAIAVNPAIKAVIPHFVGGDDVFVSVPAPAAWRFAHALAKEFEHTLTDTLYRLVPDSKDFESEQEAYLKRLTHTTSGISLGVGICFAHSSHPLADTHAAAERVMKDAKRATSGQAAAFGWIDLTEGEPLLQTDGTRTRHVVTNADVETWLGEGRTALDVFGLTSSARGVLASILRDHLTPTSRERAVDDWGRRVGWTRTSKVTELPTYLSLARWWPSVRQDEEDRS